MFCWENSIYQTDNHLEFHYIAKFKEKVNIRKIIVIQESQFSYLNNPICDMILNGKSISKDKTAGKKEKKADTDVTEAQRVLFGAKMAILERFYLVWQSSRPDCTY